MSRKRRMAVRYLTKHSRKKRAIAERLGVVNALPRKRRRLRIKRYSEEHEEYDLSRLASSKYSQLLNNATDNGNSTWSTLSDADNIPTEPYEATIVYDKTDFILTNLKAFQEYSIEVYMYDYSYCFSYELKNTIHTSLNVLLLTVGGYSIYGLTLLG